MLISNPLTNPYFAPTLLVVLGLLGVTLPLLLVAVRFDTRSLRESVLFRRWGVWAVIAPIYGLAVLGGQLPTAILLILLVLQGLREYSRMVGLPASYSRVLLVAGLLPVPTAMISREAFYMLPSLLLLAGMLQPVLFSAQGERTRHLAFAVLGWGYIAWFLAHLMLILVYVEGGQGILLAIALATALSDVGAFTAGKLFGAHKLAPRLSPNKTWEGAAGNFVGAFAGVAIMAFALPVGTGLLLTAALPVVVGAGAIWGDLLESSIKREFGAKDAGAWLPGFGGLLDRVDSLIVVVPLVFYATWLLPL